MTAISAMRLRVDYEALARQAIEKVKPADSLLIGQPRALHALTLGLELNARGYHIMVSGPSGTGRMTALRRILKDLKPFQLLSDFVYVYNFSEPEKPLLLSLPSGKGVALKKAVHNLLERLKAAVKAELSGGEYLNLRQTMVKQVEDSENKALANFEAVAAQKGFRAVMTQDEEGEPQADMEPLFQNKSLSWKEYQNLVGTEEISRETFQERRETYLHLMSNMKTLYDELRLTREKSEKDLEGMAVNYLGDAIRREVRKSSKGFSTPKLRAYFRELEKDILDNLNLFIAENPSQDTGGNLGLVRYGVNVLLDRFKSKLAPVVFETRCDPASLLGGMDVRLEPGGEPQTNFMQIRPGALVQAHGGVLVLRLEDLLANEEYWSSLVRTLDSGLVDIPPPVSHLGPLPFPIKPQSIPVQVKVVLVGPEGSYDYLSAKDPNFLRLFKISAEFDSVMDSSLDAAAEYVRFMRSQIDTKDLLPINISGMAAVLEYGHRLTGDRGKISTLFSQIADLLTESSFWAARERKKEVSGEDVRRALAEREYMFSLPEEKIDEEWRKGRLLIHIDGTAIGQVNGLAVLDRGFYRFGRPLRITATASPGRGGIVNIEGKAGLSGRIHTKGVHILEGLLKNLFARNLPFSMGLSVAFEQNYGGVEGDSASSAEACALISALGRFPIRQDIAVSGSINQAGEIQSVGGIAEKIEGFFALCKQKGLKGQGVVLPESDIDQLLLKPDVIDAVETGVFHLWGVATIQEALFCLSGRDFGVMDENGEYPEGTLGQFILTRLKSFRKKSIDSQDACSYTS